MRSNKKTYSSKDVAKRLSIQPVTVRKYSQMLENKGVSFARDNNNWRQYSEEDIDYLTHLCNLTTMGKSLDQAADHIASLYRSKLSIAIPAISLQENPLTNFLHTQQAFNEKMMNRLEAIEQRQIERDQNLLRAIRETQEVKRQLTATNQKRWWQFWKK